MFTRLLVFYYTRLQYATFYTQLQIKSITRSNRLPSHSCAESQEKDSTKPLLDEVTFIGPGNSKNAGGAKQWVCNHCKGMFTSSYTRIHAHFFGPPVGKKKSDIKRCSLAGNDRVKYEALLKKVKEAENAGISKEALSTTIVLNSWREWVKNGDENTRMVGLKIADTIKDDEFWEDVEHILTITKPIFLLIKFCDGEGPKMGEIYERMDNMLGEIKDAMQENKFSSYYSHIETIVLARWEKMTIPLHCLGFALSPKFNDRHYLQKLAPGGMARKAPNQDKEVVLGVMEAFKRIAESEEEEKMLQEQFVTFHMKKGIYSMTATQTDALTMDGIDWWATYGSETPELAEVAKKVLSQPISSSSAERNWSTYSYIHNGDMNPESDYIEGSSARLEEMVWENLDDEGVEKEKGKRQRLD
ncbi:hypothetical protein L1887_02614 [Cichorium endivia]|nr:hypothetical protein L1887_02614 [Cichorium endivia]